MFNLIDNSTTILPYVTGKGAYLYHKPTKLSMLLEYKANTEQIKQLNNGNFSPAQLLARLIMRVYSEEAQVVYLNNNSINKLYKDNGVRLKLWYI